MTNRISNNPIRARQAGFSLVELLVALAILVLILVGVLQLFDMHSRIARTQTNVADMQQSLRVSQNEMIKLVRMAGRGMLPVAHTTLTAAAHRRGGEAAAQRHLRRGAPQRRRRHHRWEAMTVVEGTDVLIIRGVISSPIYLVDTVQTANFTFKDNDGDEIPDEGVIKNVRSTPKVDRLPIDGSPLKKAIEDSKAADPCLSTPWCWSARSVTASTRWWRSIRPPATGRRPTTRGRTTRPGPGAPTSASRPRAAPNAVAYNKLSPKGAYPKELRTIAYLAPLDEYRFYVREEKYTLSPTVTELAPVLSVARYYPGTDTARPGEDSVDIADNILDLQVTLGIDRDQDGIINPEADPADPTNDEWLFNDASDDKANLDTAYWKDRLLYYLRVNTVARTDRPDLDFVSEPLDTIEDRDYPEAVVPSTDQDRYDRRFRRRLMQTTIDLRNLS